MNLKDLKLGKEYHYSDLENFQNDNIEFNEHESENDLDNGVITLGKSAIHIRCYKTNIDYWFIFHRYGNGAYYKLVYAE